MAILSSETNTILISSLLAIIVAGVPVIVAWLRAKTKQLNDLATETKVSVEQNTAIVRDVKRQTDGLVKRMNEIAEVTGFTKGRILGREEGESNEPYEELKTLEDEISRILSRPNEQAHK